MSVCLCVRRVCYVNTASALYLLCDAQFVRAEAAGSDAGLT